MQHSIKYNGNVIMKKKKKIRIYKKKKKRNETQNFILKAN